MSNEKCEIRDVSNIEISNNNWWAAGTAKIKADEHNTILFCKLNEFNKLKEFGKEDTEKFLNYIFETIKSLSNFGYMALELKMDVDLYKLCPIIFDIFLKLGYNGFFAKLEEDSDDYKYCLCLDWNLSFKDIGEQLNTKGKYDTIFTIYGYGPSTN